MRVLAVVVVLAMTAVLLPGCGSKSGGTGEETQTAGGAKPIKVGLVQINQQAIFFNQMNEGAQEAAKEAGVDLTIYNANDDPAKQNEAIANFVTQGFDAVIIVAIDVEGVKPALRDAAAAGVKVVAVDAVVEDESVSCQVGVDNKAAGEKIGQFVVDYMKQNNITDKKIGVIGALNSYIQNLRLDGFKMVVEADGATITQVVDGQNRQEVAMSAAENLFTAQPNTKIFYATGEPAMVGAVAAARSQNRTGDVKLFGWDLTSEVIKGIDDGFVIGVVQQDPKTEGYEAVMACKKLVEGQSVPSFIDVPVTIVTKDNVDTFRPIFK
ncbi:substrate-binding domain-containing protein [Coriobacteriia bacterium Es71-Z0120]|uniref:substrate-binding domain-containing protein n=1 Tax=Parvivirga hydrogeniphila TaxID=2939460 RepID=UPI002260C57F|nr:substrate-binding domain-containing protein [Parvivirga hydrogeniphila]